MAVAETPAAETREPISSASSVRRRSRGIGTSAPTSDASRSSSSAIVAQSASTATGSKESTITRFTPGSQSSISEGRNWRPAATSVGNSKAAPQYKQFRRFGGFGFAHFEHATMSSAEYPIASDINGMPSTLFISSSVCIVNQGILAFSPNICLTAIRMRSKLNVRLLRVLVTFLVSVVTFFVRYTLESNLFSIRLETGRPF